MNPVARMRRRLAKKLMLGAMDGIRDSYLEVVCGGETYTFGDPHATLRATVAIENERFFERALFGGDLGMAESYMDGDWSSPDLAAVVRMAVRNLERIEQQNKLFFAISGWKNKLFHRRNRNSVHGSKKNISYHYDLGNKFYRLLLDPATMAYSCGIYRNEDDTLEQSQLNKFDHICRKLRLGPEDHVLEIGTGWGGFAIYAAENFGCHVTTTTISRKQHDFAAAWIQERGLEDRITLLLEDYRHLAQVTSRKYDKIVSIEMFEAVGYEHYDEYFRACDRLLKPEGSMLLQTITIKEQKFKRYLGSCDFIQKYIFPGAELASNIEIQRALARCTNLQLFHMEDFGTHYARTLRAWRERFWQEIDEIRKLGFDERFINMWEYYLAYCEGAFHERHIGDVQMILTKCNNPRPLVGEPWRGTAVPSSVRVASGAD